ncbi:Clp1/GlmU family protein [Archaeoglobus profundus]|uniref:polynucleotide 5'-hydroxyl-kinase n=1 Tax=Archaeoglobus profundus (strain DSM 5631 / JCM 9629 / NBRC 100127 / Av18) TaxID=572546 RepID=D2RDG8_ARCPA|nr:Clp1/GlmU family protein [Archaeoglobus profundus]ADB58162.1 GTPase or GTP-binding protein-like protein [Archaeoglobus profundus DSM 5631]
MLVEKDTTLLIEGYAEVNVKGEAEVFGYRVKRLEVEKGKIIPLYILEDSEVEVTGNYIAVKGSTIPKSWDELVELIEQEDYKKIVLFGETDSGKSSLATYLANKLKGGKWIVDLDIGQADVAHPCAMGFGYTEGGITSISQVEMEDGFFVGVVSPTGKESRCLQGVANVFQKLEEKEGYIIVDTTGWVRGKKARAYKLAKLEIINPDLIVCFGDVPYYLKDFNVFKVDSFVLKKRSREIRSEIRSRIYQKWLEGSEVRKFKVGEVELGNTTLFKGEQIEFLEGVLDAKVLFAEKGYDFLNVCVEEEVNVGLELIKALLDVYDVKDVCIFSIDQLKGLLVGLYNERYLGCGLLRDIDIGSREIEVETPVKDDVRKIEFGEIKLESFKEVAVRVP